ncbi:efflux RND transporter periplasmic adaptor subunit [Viscerimonas tarda]
MKKITLLLVVFLAICACSSSTKEEETGASGETSEITDEITNVKAIHLSLSDFNHELISNGTVSARKKAELKFLTSENVTAIHVKNGDRVVKGQKIASLDQFKLKNSLVQSRDNMEKARLELQDVLIGQGYTLADSSKVPEAVMKIARLRSNYDQNVNQYELAEYNYKNSILYAPFDGTVANLFAREYNVPSGQEPFCTIIDINNPEIVFNVLENELPLVQAGDKIMISPFAISSYSTDGRITEINPVVDKNGMVRVKAVANSPKDKLYDGMNVKVRIQRTLGKQLVIPKEALVLRTNKKVVFTMKDGKALWNYVETGMENSTGYVVSEGLTAGDSVIYEGNINLAHESPVKLIP